LEPNISEELPDLDVLEEIRELVVGLAWNRQLSLGCCQHWNASHSEVAAAQGMTPWLYKELLHRPEAALPHEIFLIFERDYRLSLYASLLREASLRRLLLAFNNCNIPVMLLKGAYLAEVIYGDPALRPMCDVDVGVREEHFESALDLLASLGYGMPAEAVYKNDGMMNAALLHTRNGQVIDSIDLHLSISALDYYRISSSDIWNESIEAEYYENRVYFLKPELNFIHLALHNLHHSNLVRDWLDLIMILSRTSVDWYHLVGLARHLGVLRPLFWIFQGLMQHGAFQPPAAVLSELVSFKPHWLEDRLIRSRYRYFWQLYSRLKLLGGWRSRLDYLSAKMFPARDYREAFAGSPLWFRYILARLRGLGQSLRID
jgi:hypothetical protein